MTLASPGADRLDISAHLLRRGFDLVVASIATCLFRMRPVLEIIQAQCRPRTPCELQCKLCVGVTDPALAELLIRLMNVAAIALLMVRETRRRAFGRSMASAALRSLRLDLLRIHVLSVREPLDAELTHLRRKTYPGPLRVDRRFVTYDAHLTRCVCKILRMTFYASRVTRKDRGDAVVHSLMAEGAILCLGLVLGASVIEGRRAVYHRGFLYVER